MNFGARLKALREEMKLSREELAYRLGVSYHSIAKYETNNRFPDKESLIKIADLFDVSIDYLLCRTDIKSTYPNALSNEGEKDIKDRLGSLKDYLENSNGLMYDGEPLSQGSIGSLIEAIEVGLSLAKLKQKRYLLEKKEK